MNKELLEFISKSPTAYHAVDTMRKELELAGYVQLFEEDEWKVEPDGKYFVIRNGSALLAFRVPKTPLSGFRVMASHSDSPMFKIKNNPEFADDHYVRLSVERYGGMICAPWLDRPLSVAGRLIVRTENGLEVKLVDAGKDLLIIPNVAIHMNRAVNEGFKYDPKTDLIPLFGNETAKGTFMKTMADLAGVREEDILGHDLFVYNRTPGTVWGASDEFISCARLDDLQCAFATWKGFMAAGTGKYMPIHIVFDNEEVGSRTRQGAASSFLDDTLIRICACLDINAAEYRRLVAKSFMVSADNAHAVHPNHPEYADGTNRPYMNRGIVIKYSANQSYTTDGVSAAMFKLICEQAEVPYQVFLNRSDMAGGSTLGNISATQVPFNTVDIGLAQLAMHSPYETAGTKDTDYLVKASKVFYESEAE